MERVFYVKNDKGELVSCPEPISGIFWKNLKGFRNSIVHHVGHRHPVSRETFLAYYTGPKRTMYEKAVNSLYEMPVSYDDAKLKTFVKAEKINLTKKADPVPRVIQPRAPRYNVELGRYLRPVEHPIYHAIDKIWGGPTIMKGYSVEQIGRHIENAFRSFTDPVAIGFDASRFDQHVSVEALRWEHSVYSRIYGYPELLTQLLRWQIHNRGTAYASDGAFNYQVDGKRMSGDMNTSLGNCILATAITHDFVTKLGIPARLINNGDDNVLICPAVEVGRVRQELYRHWLNYGFEVISEEPVYILEQVEFCQMRPVFDGTQYTMMRDPRTTMSKDAYAVTPFNTPTAARRWMRAVGECGLSLTGGLPVKQEYYAALVKHGLDPKNIKQGKDFDSGLYYLSKLSNRKWQEVQESARYSFWLAFGYTPDEQRALEEYFRSWTPTFEWSTTGILAEIPECLLLKHNPLPPT
uniref:RNA-directed RNA polymerase n=1 Tax=Maize chlorotic mottle virus TaxID=12138 RepID=A0A5B8M9A6_MCMV|nr:p111 [Maize chlorotic mottle virus]